MTLKWKYVDKEWTSTNGIYLFSIHLSGHYKLELRYTKKSGIQTLIELGFFHSIPKAQLIADCLFPLLKSQLEGDE